MFCPPTSMKPYTQCTISCPKNVDPSLPRSVRIQYWKDHQETGHTCNWHYNQRRRMQEIFPDVFLGPFAAATANQLCNLVAQEITHIVCVRGPMERNVIKPRLPDRFQYLVIDLAESEFESVLPLVSKLHTFINEAMAQGGRVLIHGNCGSCRSAALACGYLMHELRCTVDVAFACIYRRRCNIVAYEPFMQQLKELEPIIQAQAQQSSSNYDTIEYKLPIGLGELVQSSKRSISTWDLSEQEPSSVRRKMRRSSSPSMEESCPIDME
ncbi:serine/threonine/tyrosine-interacting protein B-like [Tigriopus californicus]|uniref:serine/threonine/tyrosine-interacting protein B-like n=1 Tax=Tigriopus californicus TaxID=6832 RepID=UPI0027D9EDAE|nr:serine/threonine/tyrosine-interacting protein B-like [Tigriopus californicus]